MKEVEVNDWSTPATMYQDSKLGSAILSSRSHNGYFHCYGIRGYDHYLTYDMIVTELIIDGRVWMIDDPPHWWAIQDHAKKYFGHVLVAGLGLGLIVHALNENPRVTHITVVEWNEDVVRLVEGLLPHDKLTIVCGDFWEHEGVYDGVFFDLFVGETKTIRGEALRAYVLMFERFRQSADTPITVMGFPDAYFSNLRQSLEQVHVRQAKAGPGKTRRWELRGRSGP